MIRKIDPGKDFNLGTIPHSTALPPAVGSDFDLLLQGRLDDLRPPERVVIQYLLRMIESMLSAGPIEGTKLFFPRLPPTIPSQSSPIDRPGETIEPVLSKDEPIPESPPELSSSARTDKKLFSCALTHAGE